MTLWHWILWVLTWLSSDPASFDREAGRAAAAVTAARASMAVEAPAPTPPGPKPPKPEKCTECNGTGWIVHGDGHRTKCPCGATGCSTCPVPGASSTPGSPSVPAGRR